MDEDGILQSLRARILRALEGRAIQEGERLPSAREVASEFDVDHRIVLAAYRRLAAEGLVALRARGGIYVATGIAQSRGQPMQEQWLVDMLEESLAREIRGPSVSTLLQRATETLRLRSVVVAATDDQGFGLARELRDDFGFESSSVLAADLEHADGSLPALRRADVLVTTAAHESLVRAVGLRHGLPVFVVRIRRDLSPAEFSLILRRPAFAIVASQHFATVLREFFAGAEGEENLHVLVYGEDDLGQIPPDASVYATQRVRVDLPAGLQGQPLPPVRTIARESARELFTYLVRENCRAMRR
jgi:DNA-binding transcriptional regulator YhcF (GntR family)